jgi:hypothetical protein
MEHLQKELGQAASDSNSRKRQSGNGMELIAMHAQNIMFTC